MTYHKLRGKIKEKGLTEKEFAKQVNLSSSGLSARLNGKTEWSISEMESVCMALSIPINNAPEYFFEGKV